VPGRQPAIPPEVAEIARRLPPDVKRAVRAALRAIGANPAIGEPLQEELSGYRKYRVRRYRIIYQIVRAGRTVRIFAVGERRSIYEEAARALRSRG